MSEIAGKPSAISSLEAAAKAASAKGMPPVERWNPPFCGDIDMRIAGDGAWYYLGTPIGRPALVKLFASILRKDPERYVLVTPVERVGIVVEDVPFIAVELEVEGAGDGQILRFRSNVDDVVEAGPDHPMHFTRDAQGGYRPYIHIRGELYARANRALYYELIALGEAREIDGVMMSVLRSHGAVFPIAPLSAFESDP